MNRRDKKELKVFHGLVNYGTQAGYYAIGLREKGIDALSVSPADQFRRKIDVELLHGGNLFEKSLKHLWNWTSKLYWFFRYNTFHFYYGTSLFPHQLDLPLYRLFRKKVIMEYLGYDVQLYQYSIEKYDVTNVKYYKSPKTSILADQRKTARLRSETRYIDKQLVCAPYLFEFVPGSILLPLAIDLREYAYSPKPVPDDGIVIMHAPTSRNNKGTAFITDAINRLKVEGYNIDFDLVENVNHSELKKHYENCDLFADQVLNGWYGTASIEAMAIGRPVVCFIRESYFEHIDYGDKIPIINADPGTIYDVLKKTIDEKEYLPELGKQSRKFVESIHDLDKLTDRLIGIYRSL